MPNEYLKEMLENNDTEKVYDVLSSHLVSKKAVSILLRDPFTKADFDEFLLERQETIRDAIESMLIKEKLDIPVALQTLNTKIEKIELKLRHIIASKIGDELVKYKTTTPSHIQEKVDKRINAELKKKPDLSNTALSNFSDKLKYFDLSEYFDFIVSKNNWANFENIFKTKEQLQIRFTQLSTLRNCIRHSRELSSIEKLDGEAAIAWFEQTMK